MKAVQPREGWAAFRFDRAGRNAPTLLINRPGPRPRPRRRNQERGDGVVAYWRQGKIPALQQSNTPFLGYSAGFEEEDEDEDKDE